MFTIYTIWGSTYLAIRFMVETIPPFLGAGIRFLIPGTIIYIWRRLAGDQRPTKEQWRSTTIIGLLLLVGGNGLLTWAEQRVPSGIAALLIGSVPLWMVLIEALRKDGTRPSWKGVISLLTGFSGIILLIGPQDILSPETHFELIGLAACLIAALLWSVGSIYSRTAILPKSTLITTGMQMFAGSGALFLLSFLRGEWHNLHLPDITSRSIMGLGYLIVFGSLLGFVAYSWLLRNAPVSLISTYAYVNPLVAIALGSWLAGEALNVRIIISSIIIVSSVILITIPGRRKIVYEEPLS